MILTPIFIMASLLRAELYRYDPVELRKKFEGVKDDFVFCYFYIPDFEKLDLFGDRNSSNKLINEYSIWEDICNFPDISTEKFGQRKCEKLPINFRVFNEKQQLKYEMELDSRNPVFFLAKASSKEDYELIFNDCGADIKSEDALKSLLVIIICLISI